MPRSSGNLLHRPRSSTVYVKQDQRPGSSLPSSRMRLKVQSRICSTSLVENRGQSGLYDARDLELKLSWAVHPERCEEWRNRGSDRKSTRLNSSHANISYAVFCLKKKN